MRPLGPVSATCRIELDPRPARSLGATTWTSLRNHKLPPRGACLWHSACSFKGHDFHKDHVVMSRLLTVGIVASVSQRERDETEARDREVQCDRRSRRRPFSLYDRRSRNTTSTRVHQGKGDEQGVEWRSRAARVGMLATSRPVDSATDGVRRLRVRYPLPRF